VLLIVWHSRTGTARALAEAAYEGARGEGAARLVTAEDAGAEDVLAARGFLFVCPENLGSMSGEMKAFFDRTYYAALGRIDGRAYGTMIAAGSDGQGAQRQLDRIVTGWRLRRVVEPVIVNTAAQTPAEILAPKIVPPEVLQKCRELGQGFSAALLLGVF
jgi:NAD(P)H-dependent FMN reductase